MSNELGAGCPHGALLALRVMITLALLEGTTIGITTLLVRNVWGKLYSKEEEVIKYVAKMMPLLALSDFLDGFQCVLSGLKILSQVILKVLLLMIVSFFLLLIQMFSL